MGGCVGRSEELSYLEGVYEKVPVACAVCGRRHLGKTAILRSFCEDKPHIYLTGVPGLKSDNIDEICRSLSRFAGKEIRFDDILDLFPTVKKLCGRKRVVVIIDRYSDLVENFSEFNSYLRSFMNRELPGTKMMLIVCDNDSSIFGRFYYTLDLKPMTYLDCKGFHPDYTPLEHLMAYAIVGGTPAYQKLFVGKPMDIIRDQFFDHMSVFSLEAEGLVASETEVSSACTKVLSAMAAGAQNVKDMAAKADVSTSYCQKMVDDMVHKGLVQKEVSSGTSRRAVYSISSNIIRFFYEVVYRYTHHVEFESPQEAFEMARDDIDAYMERSFKSVCMDYVTRVYDYSFMGKLRRKDDTSDTVIDFVAAVNMNDVRRIMAARCRLHGKPFSVADLDELRERSKKVEGSNKMFAMFSGAGFDAELTARAKDDPNVILLTLDDIYRG